MTRQRKHGTTLINANGGSRKWTQVTIEFCAANPVCWLRFPGCTVRSESIDHYHTRRDHPELAEAAWNFRPSCKSCNRKRRHTPPQLIPILRAKLEARAAKSKALGFFR